MTGSASAIVISLIRLMAPPFTREYGLPRRPVLPQRAEPDTGGRHVIRVDRVSTDMLVVLDVEPAPLQPVARLPAEADIDHPILPAVCDEDRQARPAGEVGLPGLDRGNEA